MKEILILAFSLGWILAAQFTWASEVVFGPRTFTQPQKAVVFLVTNPMGPFWLQVFNGQDSQSLADSGSISINGVLVGGPQDFIQDKFGFQKDVTLQTL